MRFSEYQQAAARTVKSDLTREEKLANFALGLVCEAVESRQAVGENETIKELGDVMWYVAGICTVEGWDLGEVVRSASARGGDYRQLIDFAALVGEQYKKYLFHKKPLDIGLCQYRLAYVVSCVQKIAGNKFYSVLDGNIKKLLERHPDGFQGNYKSSDEEGSTHAVSAT